MLGLLLALAAAAGPADADTKAWWRLTGELANDRMAGRDTGSPEHAAAARIVARRFAAAGLKPAGENGTWFQPVRLEELGIDAAETRVAISGAPLRFLHDLTLSPSPGMPTALQARLAFRGYCNGALGDVKGRVVICYGSRKPGTGEPAARAKAVREAGAAGILTVADPGFTVEPPRWPFAYARSVTRPGTPPGPDDALLVGSVNAASLGKLIAGSGQDAAALVAAGTAGRPLPSFDPPGIFEAGVELTRRGLVSENVLGVLPGTDPARAREHIVLSAHLDGYGRGEPVDGDAIYNGALDDAAYVALLEQLAARRGGKGWTRPVLFAAFTGEEKGLHGARWFVEHPTVPRETLVADINLDQLRPIFPLELLTVHSLDTTSLGADVRAVATSLGIAAQADPEPERNLLRRADNWPFLQAGVPSTGFVFGYRPGTESERIYRRWYQTGYHKPQDDLAQPMDWQAAADFNRFFYALVDRVADGPRPRMLATP